MSNENEEIRKKINEMSYKEFKDKTNASKNKEKKSFKDIMKSILLWRFKVLKGIFGVRTEGKINSDNNVGTIGQTMMPQPPQSFREIQGFNPEEAYVKRIQEIGYNQLVDGRGDPDFCDCDHDER